MWVIIRPKKTVPPRMLSNAKFSRCKYRMKKKNTLFLFYKPLSNGRRLLYVPTAYNVRVGKYFILTLLISPFFLLIYCFFIILYRFYCYLIFSRYEFYYLILTITNTEFVQSKKNENWKHDVIFIKHNATPEVIHTQWTN